MTHHTERPSPAHHNATGDITMKLEIDRYDFERIIMLLDAADNALTVAANLESAKRQQAIASDHGADAQKNARTVAEMIAKYL